MILHRLRRVKELLTSPTYRRVLLCRIYCRLLRHLNPNLRYLGLADGNETTFMFLHDNVVTPYTVAVGHFARNDLEAVLKLCAKVGKSLGGTFLDVGANIGTTTIYALKSGSFNKAVCIEPAPSNLEVLRLNMEANGIAEKVIVSPHAVSTAKGQLKLALSKENCGDHRIQGNPTSAAGTSVDVDVDTLDNLLVTHQVDAASVSLVWCDTQGHEGFVLAGSESLIRRQVPFCIEFCPHDLVDAGSYEQLIKIIEQKFEKFAEVGGQHAGEFLPTERIRDFAKKFDGTIYHTDLFLIPRPV